MSVALSAVKEFLNFTTTAQDNELQDTLDRATAIISRRVGPLEPVTITDEPHTGPGPLVLNRRPVISVTSVSGGAISSGAGIDVDLEAGVIYGYFGTTTFLRSIKVSYVAGWATLPWDLEMAILELTKHLFDAQRVAGTGNRAPFPNLGMQAGAQEASGYLLPYRVQTLIEPYIVPGIA